MKIFIIINGDDACIIEQETIKDATILAENTCDHSKEVIVRELKTIIDYTKK